MKLSIVTIAYNNLDGLKKTLEIFLDGKYADRVEHVIVDGGSSDGTREFLEKLKLSATWVSEKDTGIYNAMNKGLAMAKGDYVWFLNSGDYVHDGRTLELVLNALDRHPDALYGETMMVSPSGREMGTRSEISTRKLPETLHWKSFSMGMNVGHQSFIIRRQLAVPYDETYRYVSDIDWMIFCLKQCRTVVNLKTVLACFTLEGFSSANRKASNLERYKVLKKHYGWLPNLLAHAGIIMRKLFGAGKI